FAREGLRIESADVRGGRARRVAVGEAINAATVVAGIDAVLLLQMTRDGRVILDDFAVIVGDPDAAVRAVREVHRVAPRVGARGEFGFFLAGCATNFQRRTLLFDQRA